MELDITKKPHIALDFDRTLARRTDEDLDIDRVGIPIPAMVEQVKSWLSKGYKITIFTARLGHDDFETNEKQRELIQMFLILAGLPQLPITATKKGHFTHFVDDKAIPVTENQGILEKPLIVS